jgi:hypothetical protein
MHIFKFWHIWLDIQKRGPVEYIYMINVDKVVFYTNDMPMGFGRLGARVANIPCDSVSRKGVTSNFDWRILWK